VNGELVVDKNLHELFSLWEETSYQLERRQAAPSTVEAEYRGLKNRAGPSYRLSFDPDKYLVVPTPIPSRKFTIISFCLSWSVFAIRMTSQSVTNITNGSLGTEGTIRATNFVVSASPP